MDFRAREVESDSVGQMDFCVDAGCFGGGNCVERFGTPNTAPAAKSSASHLSTGKIMASGTQSIDAVQAKVNAVTGVMQQNVNVMLENIDKGQVLEDKSSALADQARTFHKSAKQTRKHFWWQLCKQRLFLAGIFVACIIFLIIIVASTGAFNGGGGGDDSSATATEGTTGGTTESGTAPSSPPESGGGMGAGGTFMVVLCVFIALGAVGFLIRRSLKKKREAEIREFTGPRV